MVRQTDREARGGGCSGTVAWMVLKAELRVLLPLWTFRPPGEGDGNEGIAWHQGIGTQTGTLAAGNLHERRHDFPGKGLRLGSGVNAVESGVKRREANRITRTDVFHKRRIASARPIARLDRKVFKNLHFLRRTADVRAEEKHVVRRTSSNTQNKTEGHDYAIT